jgi:hypothetical protein
VGGGHPASAQYRRLAELGGHRDRLPSYSVLLSNSVSGFAAAGKVNRIQLRSKRECVQVCTWSAANSAILIGRNSNAVRSFDEPCK